MLKSSLLLLGASGVALGDELTCGALKSLYQSQNADGETCCKGRVSLGDLTCEMDTPKLSDSAKTRFRAIQHSAQVAQYTTATNYSTALFYQFPHMDIGMCKGDDCFHECVGYDAEGTPCDKDTPWGMASTLRIVRGAVQKRIETLVDAPTKLSPHTHIEELFPAYGDIQFVTAEGCDDASSPGCELKNGIAVKLTNATRKPMINDFFSESSGIAGRGFEALNPGNIANQIVSAFPANAKLNGACESAETAAECLDRLVDETKQTGPVLLATQWGVQSYASSQFLGGIETNAISERAFAKFVEGDATKTHAYPDLARLTLLDPAGINLKLDACEIAADESVRNSLMFSGATPYIWKKEESEPCSGTVSRSSQRYDWYASTSEMLKLGKLLARLGRTDSGEQLISAHRVKDMVSNTVESGELGQSLTTMLNAGVLGVAGTGVAVFGQGAAEMGSALDFNDDIVHPNYRQVFGNAPFKGGYWIGAFGATLAWSFEAQTAYVLEVGSHFAGKTIGPDAVYKAHTVFIDESARLMQN